VRTRERGLPPHLTAAAEAGDGRHTVSVDEAGDTPILRAYREVKREHPDSIILARLGDFYEMFGSDAETAAPIIGVTLTGRGFGSAGRLPMCGVPHHALGQYLRRLLEAGHSAVIWDQVGVPVSGKLVEREVTRVLSPGTITDADLLDELRTARVCAVSPRPGRVGLAALDAASGELILTEVAGDLGASGVRDELERLDVAEVLLPAELGQAPELLPKTTRTALPSALFDSGRAAERLEAVMGTATLRGLGIEEMTAAISAAGAVLGYAERCRLALPAGFVRLQPRSGGGAMRLDPPTRRNLELVGALGGNGPTLVSLLDSTRTPMGARLLRRRLQEPLTDAAAINCRLDAVAWLLDGERRDRLRDSLSAVRDLERLVGRCVQGSVSPRDLAAIRDACAVLPDVGAVLGDAAGELRGLGDACVAPAEVLEPLGRLLVDAPPAQSKEGGCIRPGADPELHELDNRTRTARDFIATLEQRERERTGVKSLKVGYNRVFGYYLEVPNAQRDSVPGDYVRKQTLVGAERYITGDLKEHEAVVLHARDRIVAREQELLRGLAATVAGHAPELLAAAQAIAVVDVTQALAEIAVAEQWVRPDVDTSTVIDIEAGRHPLVERSLGRHRFVANDCSLDAVQRLVILTGPNMAGKSTFLRQVAMIVLLAQVGSHVPAARARIGVCDRIFTRVGAQDDLSGGLSTFMVEMAETAAILRQATERSLVILDEIGRGTSTYDGLSIAQAIVEHIHESPQLNCRTLFATHYHELTALADRLPRVTNARVEVAEDGDSVTFLHRIRPGGADRSYGIHVAKLAGLPASVLQRSRTLLAELEAQRPLEANGPAPSQLDLGIIPVSNPLVDELAGLDVEALTPLAALNKLAELRDRAVR
jgi:DNA mismatch repair protein MutS